MAEPNTPGPGRSTSDAAFNEVKKLIAHRNEEAHKAARKLRIVRDREQLAQRRRSDQL
jgi:hypothetical protein